MSAGVIRRYYVARSPRLYRAMADALEQHEIVLRRRLDLCNELGAIGLLGFPGEAPTDLLYSAECTNRLIGFLPPHRLNADESADFEPTRPIPWVHTPDPEHPWGEAIIERLRLMADPPMARAICKAMGAEQYVVTAEKKHATGAVFSDAYMVFAVPFSPRDAEAPSMPADLIEIPRAIAKHLWQAAGDEGETIDE